jgi:hypothetical protein
MRCLLPVSNRLKAYPVQQCDRWRRQSAFASVGNVPERLIQLNLRRSSCFHGLFQSTSRPVDQTEQISTMTFSGDIQIGRDSMSCTVTRPRKDRYQARPAMKVVAVVAACFMFGLPAAAESPSCPRELGHTDITLIKSFLHLRSVAQAPEDQQCAAYRQHAATVSKVREVLERCLSGAKRDVDLRELKGAIDGAHVVIARLCDK